MQLLNLGQIFGNPNVNAMTKQFTNSKTCIFFHNTQFLLISAKTIYTHGLVQNCSNSIANALELLQSCT